MSYKNIGSQMSNIEFTAVDHALRSDSLLEINNSIVSWHCEGAKHHVWVQVTGDIDNPSIVPSGYFHSPGKPAIVYKNRPGQKRTIKMLISSDRNSAMWAHAVRFLVDTKAVRIEYDRVLKMLLDKKANDEAAAKDRKLREALSGNAAELLSAANAALMAIGKLGANADVAHPLRKEWEALHSVLDKIEQGTRQALQSKSTAG